MLHRIKPILPTFRRNIKTICAGLAFLLVVDFLQLYIPLIIKHAVDALTRGNASIRLLLECGGGIVAIAVTIAILRYGWRIFIFGNAREVEKDLRRILFEHLQTLSMNYYHRTKTGNLMAHMVNDIEAVRMACGIGVVAFTDGLVMGLAAIGFMLAINVKLTLIALIPMPGIIFVGRFFSKRIHQQFKSVQKQFSELTENVREAFAGIRVVKAYNREEWQHDRLQAAGDEYISANMHLARSMGFFFPAMVLFTNVSLAIVIWLGGKLTIVGTITTGDFIAFMSYLNLLAWPMMAMGWVVTLIQRGSASMDRINGILEESPEIRNPARPARIDSLIGKIEIRDLTFSHAGIPRDMATLENVSAIIEPGWTVTLVGGTGSGKTTLLDLLPRLLDPPNDTIFLDGLDIRHIPLNVLRSKIGLVSQESFLFSETIRGNLTLGADGFSGRQAVGDPCRCRP